MINADDIRDFSTNHAAADKFVERAARGLPPDRWATTDAMHKVAKAYETLWYLFIAAGEEAEALRRAEFQKGVDAMKMAGEE